MSISLPLYLLLIPYGIFVLVFLFYAFFNLFQLYKHGVRSLRTQMLGIIFILLIAGIFGTTFIAADSVDWSGALVINGVTPN